MTYAHRPQQHVLLVDDDEDMMRLLEVTLQNAERYTLLTAREGEEALRLVRQTRPQVVFLDVMMPRMDGFEVCRILKEDPGTRDVKVILLTALTQERDRVKAQEVGADGYLTKPFSPTQLIDTVDHLLGAY